MTSYLFSYETTRVRDFNPKLIAFVKNNKFITDWTSPFDGAFILKSELDTKELTKMFGEFFEDKVAFFVTSVSKDTTSGAFPDPVWTWIAENIGSPTMYDGQPVKSKSDN